VQDVEKPLDTSKDDDSDYGNVVKKEEEEDHFTLPSYLVGLEGLVLDTEELKPEW
jgi:hypothetical protein